jgi:hypothetical protein
MRRVGRTVTAALVVALGVAWPAAAALASPLAAPTPIPVPSATPGTAVCTISGNAAVGITGLVATSSGYVVIDGRNDWWPQLRIVYLDKSCVRAGSTQAYSGAGPIDPQDLAVDRDGALWVADTGDVNPVNPTRTVISLWKVPSRTGGMTHYKFSYPSGDGAFDTDALLLNGNGAPIFVTHSVSGPANIYTFTGTLVTGSVMRLTKAGTFQPEQTGTPNKLGSHGQAQNAITGGAVSPDGRRVALRTLSDAYEWDVTGGDVIAALTKGTPRITPLKSADQGEAIAYSADGESFLTVSFSDVSMPILRYAPAAAIAPGKSGSASGGKARAVKTPGVLRRWFNQLTFNQLMAYLGGLAALGLLLVGIGIYGIRRSRRAGPALSPSDARPSDPRDGPAGAAAGGLAAASVPVSPPGYGGGPPPSGPARNFYPEYGEDGQDAPPATPGPVAPPARGVSTPTGGGRGSARVPGGHASAPVPDRDGSGAGAAPGGRVYGGRERGGAVYGAGGGSYSAPADPYQSDPAYSGEEDRRPSPYGRPAYRDEPDDYAGRR